jgi:hypothetical protein
MRAEPARAGSALGGGAALPGSESPSLKKGGAGVGERKGWSRGGWHVQVREHIPAALQSTGLVGAPKACCPRLRAVDLDTQESGEAQS